jgi:hypothetical protein
LNDELREITLEGAHDEPQRDRAFGKGRHGRAHVDEHAVLLDRHDRRVELRSLVENAEAVADREANDPGRVEARRFGQFHPAGRGLGKVEAVNGHGRSYSRLVHSPW